MENTNPWVIRGSSKARLVSLTPNAEETIAYIARVTSKNQTNPKITGLLRYCAKHGHFSVFEQATMTVEIVIPLAISIQLIRHGSNKYQQFSGRYENQELMAQHTGDLPAFLGMFYMPEEARTQDDKNRQNSFFAEDPDLTDKMWAELEFAYKACHQAYKNMIDIGICKEQARFVLPEGVYTRLYMTGNIRSFIHYLQARDKEGVAQWEHVELARAIKEIFSENLPVVYEAFFAPDEEEPDPRDEEIATLRDRVKQLEELVAAQTPAHIPCGESLGPATDFNSNQESCFYGRIEPNAPKEETPDLRSKPAKWPSFWERLLYRLGKTRNP